MDIHLKQWRGQQHESEQQQQQQSSAKLPRLLLDPYQHQQPSESSALPLFAPEPTSKCSSNLSADSITTATKFSRMGSYFSMAQWQELELQALIFRHMLAGAAVPPELLHLVKKSLLGSPPYFLPHPLQHYPPYQPALLQSGYWGRGAMDPEPGRCRRTDGKKWRCSRDVVAGHKYCERHMHRGRNRSRKPVEIPTPTTPAGGVGSGNGGVGGLMIKTNSAPPMAAQPSTTTMGGGGTHYSLSVSSPSFDLLHLNQRPSEAVTETKGPFGAQNELSEDGKSGGRILRHFFDDWPRSIQETEGTTNYNNPGTSTTTNLSISVPGNNPSSDFSLKLSTGNGDDVGEEGDQNVHGHVEGNAGRERTLLNWGTSWGPNQMGGPLAEALRSSTSTSNSSPTSVLHQLRCSTSDASYMST